jgi:hypothetical protein
MERRIASFPPLRRIPTTDLWGLNKLQCIRVLIGTMILFFSSEVSPQPVRIRSSSAAFSRQTRIPLSSGAVDGPQEGKLLAQSFFLKKSMIMKRTTKIDKAIPAPFASPPDGG